MTNSRGLTGLRRCVAIAKEPEYKLVPFYTQPMVSKLEVANDDIVNYVKETFFSKFSTNIQLEKVKSFKLFIKWSMYIYFV